MAKKSILGSLVRCKLCNKTYFAQGFNKMDKVARMMDKEQICYDCAYWKNLIVKPPSNMEVVGSSCLRVFPKVQKKTKTMILGGKGKLRYFIRTDWSEMFSSNDVWPIGTIPENFRNQLPATLIEIPRNVYYILEKNKRRCSARGCMDRYHCLRYKLEIEDKLGAFNKVPSTWKVGNERCKFFINLKRIISDDGSVQK